MAPRPLSIMSAGFSTMADRPLVKSASDGNLRIESNGDSDSESINTQDDSCDLNREVAALSNKLIKSINHQTKLDDSLSATKHELELSKARIRQLEQVAKEHNDMLANGLLVEKKHVEFETQQLLDRLKEESLQRGQAEKDKRHIEQELENLTTALFDEANQMVSAARRERDAMDRKNEQLKSQLIDTETLLASHQEQLAELKAVMQQMTREREETEANGTPSTPSTGNWYSKESMGRIFESLHLIPNSASIDMPPCPPTSLINLVHPVLRHDVAAYHEFCEVLTQPRPSDEKVSPKPSRLSGHSFTSIQMMGMGMGISALGSPSTSVGSSLFGMKKRPDSSLAVHSPTGSISSNSTYDSQAALQALKETKFFKRAMMEDVEPTLRLDNAPGLSWLARRNVLSAITEGGLVIDPMPSSPKVNIFACALCGESKADEQHARTHRMRTSDNPNAQRYPLCWYCTNRLRSVCDFMAFLRTLKEGLWKCEGSGDQMHAWEESVKLRERMFWARVGGGVVPAFLHRDSTRSSIDGLNGINGVAQTETPPRTPLMASILEKDTPNVPKTRANRSDLYLTPEKPQLNPRVPLAPSPLNLSNRALGKTDIPAAYRGNVNNLPSQGQKNDPAIQLQGGVESFVGSEAAEPRIYLAPEEHPLPESPLRIGDSRSERDDTSVFQGQGSFGHHSPRDFDSVMMTTGTPASMGDFLQKDHSSISHPSKHNHNSHPPNNPIPGGW